MSKTLTRLFCWKILMLFCVGIFAQNNISFSASTDARQVVLGGYFEIIFTLENAQGKNFQPPKFNGFNVLSGPNQSISTTSVNGQWSRTLSYSYNLQPKKVGKFTIGPGSIDVNGKTYKTKSVSVEVVKGKNNTATTQSELEEQVESQIYIKAIPSTIDAWAGQQIILDYKIYTSRQVENYKVLTESTYPGFFAEPMSFYDGRVVKEVIDGVQFSTKVIKRVGLFPQRAGILEIEPLQMQVAVVSPNQPKRRSIFSFPEVMRVNVKSDLVNINVKPLPSGAPASFSGAVGNYEMSAKTMSRQITTNDAFSVQLTIRGDGDLKQVQAPDLMLGDSFEIFDAKVVHEKPLRETGGSFYGEKVFDYLVTPKHPGRFKIQPQFTYFDPDSVSYVTLKSNAPAIAVAKGDQSKAVIPKSEPTTAVLNGIKKVTHFEKPSGSFWGTPLFWILLGLPLLGLGGVYFYKQRQLKLSNIDPEVLKRQRANKVALKRLETANQFFKDNKSRDFYDEISRAMLGYVSDKLNIPFSKMSKNNVKEKLESLKVSDALIEKFIHIIKTSEMALFAGKDNSAAMQEVYQEAVEVVTGVEGELIN